MAKEKMTQEMVEEVVNENVQTENVAVELSEITLEEFKEKVTFKDRIGVFAKQEIVKIVYDNCVKKDEENGVYYIDNIMAQVAFNFAILANCTNFYEVIENASVYTYDYLNGLGVFDCVLMGMNTDDYKEVMADIESFSDRVANLNSVGSFIYRILGDFTKKTSDIDLNKLIRDIPKVINGIDKDALAIFAKELGNGSLFNKQTKSNLKVLNNDKK